MQETPARALAGLGFWRHGSDMRARLFAIMHHQYANQCRRDRSRPELLPLDTAGAPESRSGSRADQHAELRDTAARLIDVASAVRAFRPVGAARQ